MPGRFLIFAQSSVVGVEVVTRTRKTIGRRAYLKAVKCCANPACLSTPSNISVNVVCWDTGYSRRRNWSYFTSGLAFGPESMIVELS